jgi:hypothetical protein
MLRFFLSCLSLLFIQTLCAQEIDTTTEDLIDYSQFGDAAGVKRFATQKVLNQTPNRIVSIGYEFQTAYRFPIVTPGTTQNFNSNRLAGIRAQVNVPVISTTKLIWQIGANYWKSTPDFEEPINNPFISKLKQNGLLTTGINTTIFKPLNEKNFFIVQLSADLNGVFEKFSDIQTKAVTLSGTALYGWKQSDKNMYGVGIARTYRAGQIIYLPVVLWNKTFNDQWGMELLLPARGHLRYNISTSNILQLGFELEGNQFRMRDDGNGRAVYIQRGEFKPRIMWDKKLFGFIWLNAQAGLRYNWRFDVMNEYNARKESQLIFNSPMSHPVYFSLSLNFVSP